MSPSVARSSSLKTETPANFLNVKRRVDWCRAAQIPTKPCRRILRRFAAGDRAYKLKRKGVEVELKAKTVRVDEIELTHFDPDTMQMSIRVSCGKGTYIRSLARDIGRALNSGAYLTALCRTRLGDVRIDNCLTLDDFPQWLDSQEIEISQ